MTDLRVPLARVQELIDDGYTLDLVDVGAARYRLRVIAGPDACEECLVPDDVLAAILSDELTGAGHDVESVEVEHG